MRTRLQGVGAKRTSDVGGELLAGLADHSKEAVTRIGLALPSESSERESDGDNDSGYLVVPLFLEVLDLQIGDSSGPAHLLKKATHLSIRISLEGDKRVDSLDGRLVGVGIVSHVLVDEESRGGDLGRVFQQVHLEDVGLVKDLGEAVELLSDLLDAASESDGV